MNWICRYLWHKWRKTGSPFGQAMFHRGADRFQCVRCRKVEWRAVR